jgi:hypothetical protein
MINRTLHREIDLLKKTLTDLEVLRERSPVQGQYNP